MKFNLGKDRVNTLKEFLIRSLKHDLDKKEEFWALRDLSLIHI